MTGSRARDQFLAAIFALTGLVILADQSAIILTQVLPAHPAVIGWRYGSVGLTVGRATPLLLADLLLILSATWLAHRGALRALAWAHFVIALILLAALVLFGLDAIQVIGGMPEAEVVATQLAAARAAAMLVVASAFAIWAGWLLWQHAAAMHPEARTQAERRILVVGAEGRDASGGMHGS